MRERWARTSIDDLINYTQVMEFLDAVVQDPEQKNWTDFDATLDRSFDIREMHLVDLFCFHEVIKSHETRFLEQVTLQEAKKRVTAEERADLLSLVQRLGPSPPLHNHVVTGTQHRLALS